MPDALAGQVLDTTGLLTAVVPGVLRGCLLAIIDVESVAQAVPLALLSAYVHTCMHKVLAMQKRMTISINSEVYEGLVRVVGRRKISGFLENLARPYVVEGSLEQGYAAMAADEEREHEAAEWSDGLIGEVADAPR